jgi:hypothetical protein
VLFRVVVLASSTFASGRWTNRWALGRTGEISLPIRFDVRWVTSGEHHAVRVQPGPADSNMGRWDTQDTGAVASHEFGHMIGNPDEYARTDQCPNRSPVSTGTIMDKNSNTIPSRLLDRVAGNVGSSVVAVPA